MQWMLKAPKEQAWQSLSAAFAAASPLELLEASLPLPSPVTPPLPDPSPRFGVAAAAPAASLVSAASEEEEEEDVWE